jgi:hypothetical protein
MLFVSIGTLVISYFISRFHFLKVSKNNLILIDQFVEDHNSLEVKSPNSFISIIQFGLRLGHKIIYDFSLLKAANQQFENGVEI